MKDFNLTSAKDGAKVCTKDGKSVRLLALIGKVRLSQLLD